MSLAYESRFDGLTIRSDTGQSFLLSNEGYINSGRDGEVFRVDETLAAKIFYKNPIEKAHREKLQTLCAQRAAFHELVVSPIGMVRLEGQSGGEFVGFLMKFVPEAKPLSAFRWKTSIAGQDEPVFDRLAADFAYDLSDALESLHATRVFVCDLKPDNILVSNLRPHLVDFDSCAMPNYPGETFTVPYLDPIIRDGVPNAVGENQAFSALSDWWALAVILFELFLGALPWVGNHPKYRRDPLVNRSFNYSAVLLDPIVVAPRVGLRSGSWLEEKPRIRNYFARVFSPDLLARTSPVEVLDVYFPRDESARSSPAGVHLMDRLVHDDRDRQFFREFWELMLTRSRQRAAERVAARIELLNRMYGG